LRSSQERLNRVQREPNFRPVVASWTKGKDELGGGAKSRTTPVKGDRSSTSGRKESEGAQNRTENMQEEIRKKYLPFSVVYQRMAARFGAKNGKGKQAASIRLSRRGLRALKG